MVTEGQPSIRAPLRGCFGPYSQDRHQAGHFGFSQSNFFAAPFRRRNVFTYWPAKVDEIVADMVFNYELRVKNFNFSSASCFTGLIREEPMTQRINGNKGREIGKTADFIKI
jgi:hypothetical protein